MNTEPKVGDRVRVKKHWLRHGQLGRIIESVEQVNTHRHLVQFAKAYPGGGIDGDKLWLESIDFEVVS